MCAHWHALAKLRMHTDQTLSIFDNETSRIGTELRKFANETCASFDTKELKREVDARKRRQSKNTKLTKQSAHSKREAFSFSNGPRQKKFNLWIYKLHSLGDFPNTIRTFGTSDTFSTEPVSHTVVWDSPLSFTINTGRTRAPHSKSSIQAH